MLMVDVSGSELFGTKQQFKSKFITEIAKGLLCEINQTAKRYADRADFIWIFVTSVWTRDQQAGIPASMADQH